MEVLNEIDAAEGDTVEVEISSAGIVRKTFLLYILPAVFFIAGMGFCLWAGLNEWFSLAGGFFCLIMAFFLVSVVDKSYSKKESLKPRIKRIIR
jgi:positive regulator of sigma E activity